MHGLPAPQLTRHRLGLTQIQLAEWLGSSQPTISKWESGDDPPSDVLDRYRVLCACAEEGLESYRSLVRTLFRNRL